MTKPCTSDRRRVRAVVLNFGQPVATAECARSLLSQSWTPLDVVLVDNYSTAACAEQLRLTTPSEAHLILNPTNSGYAAGNNVGCRTDELPLPDYILILNNDVILPKTDDVAQLVAALESDVNVVAVSPLVHTLSSTASANEQIQVRRNIGFLSCLIIGSWWLRRIPGLARFHYSHIYGEVMPFSPNTFFECDSINGSCFLIRAEFFRSIGYFDEGTFLYFEEMILGRQISLRGKRCALVTRVTVDHYQGLSTEQRGSRMNWTMHAHAIRSQVHYCRRYLKSSSFACRLLVAVRAVDFASKWLLQTVLGWLLALRSRGGAA